MLAVAVPLNGFVMGLHVSWVQRKLEKAREVLRVRRRAQKAFKQRMTWGRSDLHTLALQCELETAQVAACTSAAAIKKFKVGFVVP